MMSPSSLLHTFQKAKRVLELKAQWSRVIKGEATKNFGAQYWPVREWAVLLKNKKLKLHCKQSFAGDAHTTKYVSLNRELALTNYLPLWEVISSQSDIEWDVWMQWGKIAMSVGNTNVLKCTPGQIQERLLKTTDEKSHPQAVYWLLTHLKTNLDPRIEFKRMHPNAKIQEVCAKMMSCYIEQARATTWTPEIFDRACTFLGKFSSPALVQHAIEACLFNPKSWLLQTSIQLDMWPVLIKHCQVRDLPITWVAAIKNLYVEPEYQTPEYRSLGLYALGIHGEEGALLNIDNEEEDNNLQKSVRDTNHQLDVLLHTFSPTTMDELFELLPLLKQGLYTTEPLPQSTDFTIFG